MRSTRLPFFLAALAVLLTLPSRSPAEEPDGNDEAEASTTGTATTEAGAPSADEAPAPKRVLRAQREARPRAPSRNPDSGGGGGGGGGGRAVPRDDREDDDDAASVPPPAPTGKPAPDTMHCDMPPLHHINVHIRGGNGNRMIADATPIVCSSEKGTKFERYCQDTMNDNNRGCCPVKPEGHPMRLACELLALGKDPTDGVAGPRWQYIGKDGGVEKREDNPFLAFAYGKGVARACSNVQNVCGEASFEVPQKK